MVLSFAVAIFSFAWAGLVFFGTHGMVKHSGMDDGTQWAVCFAVAACAFGMTWCGIEPIIGDPLQGWIDGKAEDEPRSPVDPLHGWQRVCCAGP
jgi:hypothetical protein